MQPFGLATWLWGTIFIDRVNKKEAQQQVNKTAEIINRRKVRNNYKKNSDDAFDLDQSEILFWKYSFLEIPSDILILISLCTE